MKGLPHRSRLLAPVFALLLVFSAMGGGFAVQPAAAVHECGDIEQMALFALGSVGYTYDKALRDGKCTESHMSNAVEELQELDGEQTELDLYNRALQAEADYETHDAMFSNYLNDSQAAAWMQTEIVIAESFQNGDAKSVAQSKARVDGINDYYTVKQRNLLEKWNTQLTTARMLRERAENETNMSASFVDIDASGYQNHGYTQKPVLIGFSNQTVELMNGSEMTVQTVIIESRDDLSGSNGPVQREIGPGYQDNHMTWGGTDSAANWISMEVWLEGFHVKAPTEDHTQRRFMEVQPWFDYWNQIESQQDNLHNESDAFVNATWDSYDSGEINASDVISRNTAMFQYGETTVNGEATLYSHVAALQSLGLSAPSLNGTGTMEVTVDSTLHHGLLMAREAPNGTWKANTTYNASNISGPVFLVTTTGEKIDLEDQFTVGTISNRDGTTEESVNATRTVYKTSDTSELIEKMDAILQLTKEVEAAEQDVGGGSSGGGNIPPWAIGVGLLAVAALAIGGNAQRGGRY